jgi:hypothetical protein
MDWHAESSKDAQLLERCDLVPLDVGLAAGDVDLLAMVEGHNDRTALATGRLRILAAERQNLTNFEAWQDHTAAELMAERARLRTATWDALRELRQVLEEREDVLGQIELRLLEQYHDASQARDRAVATAKRDLAREHRLLQRVNPANADRHFGQLVASDEGVQQSARQQTAALDALNGIADSKRKIVVAQSTVRSRQREVFAALLG